MQQSLGKIHLEDVAGMDVLDRPARRAQVAGRREVARQKVAVRDRMLPGQFAWQHVWTTDAAVGVVSLEARVDQRATNLPQASLRASGSFFRLDLGQPLRDDPRAVFRVVERHDDVVQPDRHGGDPELVGGRHGQRLELPAQVVAEQSGRAALKRRQSVDRRCPKFGHPSRQPSQAICGDRHRLAVIERIGRDERIATQRAVAQGAVKKQAVRQSGTS